MQGFTGLNFELAIQAIKFFGISFVVVQAHAAFRSEFHFNSSVFPVGFFGGFQKGDIISLNRIVNAPGIFHGAMEVLTLSEFCLPFWKGCNKLTINVSPACIGQLYVG